MRRKLSPTSPRPSKVLRRLVWVRDKGICQLCGKAVTALYTLDHVIPQSHGGSTTLSNCRLAHIACNSRRGNRAARTAAGGYVR
jgi:5-methylcytosine-specific restriction endonuclease McrA